MRTNRIHEETGFCIEIQSMLSNTPYQLKKRGEQNYSIRFCNTLIWPQPSGNRRLDHVPEMG